METLTKDITIKRRNSSVLSGLKTPQLHMNVLINYHQLKNENGSGDLTVIFPRLENTSGAAEAWELNSDAIIAVVNRLNTMNENTRFCHMCFML